MLREEMKKTKCDVLNGFKRVLRMFQEFSGGFRNISGVFREYQSV